ncbi:MAG TPA: TadE/TadG family type IV pilus assembly protein [Candidatus Limnocylindrales bacterium]|jgi:Flp pilus assembly protein TadG
MRIRERRTAVRSRRKGAGQALVEFALILPIMLTLFGAAVDFARVYSAYINLQEATRNAAEYIATDQTVGSDAAALTEAKRLVCLEIVGAVDVTGNCPGPNSPTVTKAISPAPSTWANTGTAATTVEIVVTEQFKMLLPYPLMDKGQWPLTADVTFSVIRGRR